MYPFHRPRGILIAVILAIALVSIAGATSSQDNPPDPQPLPPTGIGWLDHIYYGAVPPQGDQQPVLVFVHGLGRTAQDWWTANGEYGVNDMYATAYHTGYRTAFVTLDFPEDEPPHDMWDNGKTLSRQLKAIARHYRVDQVDIVAHSKGGVDSQAAIVYYGGWEHVRNVFTLGTPHQGSELADLLYSDWAEWLAELLGGQNDATLSMTTGYMQLFRALTDPRPEDDAVKYYSGAGTGWDTDGALLQLGGQYLSQFGSNDGFVTVASTQLPGAQTLFVQPYNHFNIHMGHTSFSWIEAVLRGTGPYRVYLPVVNAGDESLPGAERQEGNPALESGVILRGGRLSGPVTEVVPIEPHARAVTFDLLVSEETVRVTIIGPDGAPRRVQGVAGSGQGPLGAAFHWVHVATQPMAGEWMLRVDGPPGAAYLLITTIDSPLRVRLHGLPDCSIAPGWALALSADADDLRGQPIVRQTRSHLTRLRPEASDDHGVEVKSDLGASLVEVPSEEGIYAVSVTVAGQTAESMPFERSFVRSLAVVKPETLGGGPTVIWPDPCR